MKFNYLKTESDQLGLVLTQADIPSGETETYAVNTNSRYNPYTIAFTVNEKLNAENKLGAVIVQYSLSFLSDVIEGNAIWHDWNRAYITGGTYPIRVVTPTNFFRIKAEDKDNIPNFTFEILGTL